MDRREVRAFLKSGVDAITPSTEFGYGLITDFNSIRSHRYPAVWQETKPVVPELPQNTGAPLDNWEISLIIAKPDKMDSLPKEYEEIIDQCDLIAQKLIYKYRNIVSGYKNSTLEGIKREPFIKKHADCLTGVTLSFTLIDPDKTNVC